MSGAAGASGSAGEQAGAGEGGAGGESGSGGGGGAAGETMPPAVAADPDCDFNGIWIANQVTVSEALTLPQSSNNWYYLEFKQSGTTVEVSKHLDCGIQIVGSATVTLSRKTLEALLTANSQVGRKGSLMKMGNNCAFQMSQFWSIRGAQAEPYLPGGKRDSTENIAAVSRAQPLPTREMTSGAIDTEMDGHLGVAFQVTGIATGTRNSVQRDWTRWFTEPGYEIRASADWMTDLKVRADFDNEEKVIDPSGGLLTSLSMPSSSYKHIIKLRFLGRNTSDPRVNAIVKANDADTCFAIQDAMKVEQF